MALSVCVKGLWELESLFFHKGVGGCLVRAGLKVYVIGIFVVAGGTLLSFHATPGGSSKALAAILADRCECIPAGTGAELWFR